MELPAQCNGAVQLPFSSVQQSCTTCSAPLGCSCCPSPNAAPLHAAYQGSTHPRPVSVLKRVLVSRARTQGCEGSQQTLLSSEGLRRRRGRERERERGLMSKGNSEQQMEALNDTVRLRSGYPPPLFFFFSAEKKKSIICILYKGDGSDSNLQAAAFTACWAAAAPDAPKHFPVSFPL